MPTTIPINRALFAFSVMTFHLWQPHDLLDDDLLGDDPLDEGTSNSPSFKPLTP